MQENRAFCILRLECNAVNGVQVRAAAQTLWLFLKPRGCAAQFGVYVTQTGCVTQTERLFCPTGWPLLKLANCALKLDDSSTQTGCLCYSNRAAVLSSWVTVTQTGQLCCSNWVILVIKLGVCVTQTQQLCCPAGWLCWLGTVLFELGRMWCSNGRLYCSYTWFWYS
jgi:hypothetical protein